MTYTDFKTESEARAFADSIRDCYSVVQIKLYNGRWYIRYTK